jgi:uncharacterized protein
VDDKARAQIAVVTIKSLDGLEASVFANQLFKKWGVGHKGDNRGVLILVAVNDHKYWTEVGYGLEPILPDGKIGGFGREMVPKFRAGDFSGAILHLTVQIAEVIAADRGINLASLAGLGPSEGYVMDLAYELDARTQAQVTAVGTELDQKAHAQILVITTASLAGLKPDEFAAQSFEKYRVGQKDDDRGFLFLVLPHHDYRMQFGSGLRSVLPKEKLENMGREIDPFLGANDYNGAVAHVVAYVAGEIAAERAISLDSLANLSLANQPRNPGTQNGPATYSQIVQRILVLVVFPIAFIWIAILVIKTKSSGGGSGGHVSFGGSWGGGGGGGGFGGFGGGSSGGGGAGGGW